jgi:heptaprenyl diphosphate synthase
MAEADGWLESPGVRAGLARLDPVLRGAVRSDDAALERITMHLVARAGKRLRPALLLLAHGAEQAGGDALTAAAAVELIHLASLHHDDVMDRAKLRRGQPSANARWGNVSAVLAGTYLFSRAGLLLAALPPGCLERAAEASSRLCTGQLREAENAFNADLAVDEHLEILRLKTSALFELPVRLGAALGLSSPAREDALGAYGRHLGLAFQLHDDVLDFVGSADVMGKSAGADLAAGVYSLPVLLLLRRGDDRARRCRDLLRRNDLPATGAGEAIALVRDSGTVAEASALAREEAARALAALDPIADGSARRSLARLTRFAVNRVH